MDATDKSLLLLFFRKETLSCLLSFPPHPGSYAFSSEKEDSFFAFASVSDHALPVTRLTGALPPPP
ncbi:MAG TPA: hypothetical protein VMB71_11275 [Acetobacteraceae bacterium]|nr:hypothetical protein [Acetobacteraceae bacterium]